MREHKFRITYQHEETGRLTTRFITLGEAIPDVGERWYVIGKDQYTGRKDRKGCEIYESDIVQKEWEIVGNRYENPDLLPASEEH